MHTILVTGSAGFIGSNLVKRLFKDMKNGTIVGIDNLNSYYDVSLKEYRLAQLEEIAGQARNEGKSIAYHFVKGSIADRDLINRLFAEYKFDIVVNLTAQAGVRYSIENPDVYIESNIIGFYNILEACRHSKDLIAGMDALKSDGAALIAGEDPLIAGEDPRSLSYQGVQHLVYASSSSVYGGNLAPTIVWITPYRYMLPPKRATS